MSVMHTGPGGAQGPLQELQVPLRQRRVPAGDLLAAARRQAAHRAGAPRAALAHAVAVLAAEGPGRGLGPAGAGAHGAALVVRRRRVLDDVHPRRRGRPRRERQQRRRRRWARRGATAPGLHRLGIGTRRASQLA